MKLNSKLKRQIDSYFANISEEEFKEIVERYKIFKPIPTKLEDIDNLDPRVVGMIDYLKENIKETQPILDLITLYELRKHSENIYGSLGGSRYPQWEIKRDPIQGSLKIMRVGYPERDSNRLLRFVTSNQAQEFINDQIDLLKKLTL